MGGWRRGAPSDWGEHRHQKQQGGGGWGGRGGGVGSTRSSAKYGRPPLASGSWHPTVPAWEKRFCTSVCLIPWGKLCETKRVMSYYKNVVDWDDSAGEEAFQNAKARYWAEINGLPCDSSLPGPDLYIDDVDWDAEIDPQLLLDLDKQPPPPDVEENNGTLGFLSSGWDKEIPCTGWEDAEDPPSPVKDATVETSWVNQSGNGNSGSGWDLNNNGWGGGWDLNNNGWGGGLADNSGWGAGAMEDDSWKDKRRDNSWGQWENRNNELDYSGSRRYGRKWEGGGRYGSRFQASRYQGNDYYQANNNNWRNCRGRKRTDYKNEQLALGEQPLAPRHWNSMQSCGPMNRQGSAGGGGSWCWEKPIS